MDGVPPTMKTELEKLDEEIEVEQKEWQRLGIHPGMLNPQPPAAVWELMMRVQAMMNMILLSGICTEDEMNIQFKKLLLADMRIMRSQAQEQKRAAIVPNAGVEVPKIKLVDKDGRDIKL